MKAGSNLEKILASGQFAVTGELGPPKGADVAVIERKANLLKGNVDSINVTDNQTAIVRMSSIAVSAILFRMGLEPNMQMVCRDRNRIAMQSDIFGAYALGIRNILCLSGDHQKFGNQPTAKNVFDLDSIQWIYDMDKFERFMKMAGDRGLHEKIHILAGVTPLKSVGMAKYMKEKVAGMEVPDEIINRMKAAGKEKAREEGLKICVEQIQRLKSIPGVHGIHLMAIEWE